MSVPTLPAKSAHPARAVVLSLITLVVLATLGAGLWIGLHGTPATAESSIFDQVPSVGANGGPPLSTQDLAVLHPLWTYKFAPDLANRLVVANGIAYVQVNGSTHTDLLAMQQGTPLWRYHVPGQPPAFNIQALAAGGSAVFMATSTTVYALDGRTGQMLWSYQAEAPLYFGLSASDLLYAGGRLFFCTDEQVHALDAATGTLAWSYRFTADQQSAYSPIAPRLAGGADAIYLSLATSPYQPGAALTALDSGTGRVLWQVEEAGAKAPLLFDPVVLGGNVLIRRAFDRVSALDTKTGATLWTVAVKAPESSSSAGMATDGQSVYVEAAGELQAYDLNTGRLVWSSGQLAGTRISWGPVASNGVVYIASVAPVLPLGHSLFAPVRAPHWLYAFDAVSGRVLRMLQQNDSTYESSLMRADEGHLYVLGNRSFIGADQSAANQPDMYVLGV